MFYFKQKTAYEMRIRDWSSDVCSSDRGDVGVGAAGQPSASQPGDCRSRCATGRGATAARSPTCRKPSGAVRAVSGNAPCQDRARCATRRNGAQGRTGLRPDPTRVRGWTLLRSEEHTSELQSLMRISYAVFCLKKKTTHQKDKLK